MASPPKRSETLHRELFIYIREQLTPDGDLRAGYDKFMDAALEYVTPADRARAKCAGDILIAMENRGHISVGQYGKLIKMLTSANLTRIATGVEQRQTEINTVLNPNQETRGAQDKSKGKCIEEGADAKSSTVLHNELKTFIGRELVPELKAEFRGFLTNAGSYLTKGVLAQNKSSAEDILDALEREKRMSVGNYKTLLAILESAHLDDLKSEVEKKIPAIEKQLGAER